jgi:biopolymer transport protein ExbD
MIRLLLIPAITFAFASCNSECVPCNSINTKPETVSVDLPEKELTVPPNERFIDLEIDQHEHYSVNGVQVKKESLGTTIDSLGKADDMQPSVRLYVHKDLKMSVLNEMLDLAGERNWKIILKDERAE